MLVLSFTCFLAFKPATAGGCCCFGDDGSFADEAGLPEALETSSFSAVAKLEELFFIESAAVFDRAPTGLS